MAYEGPHPLPIPSGGTAAVSFNINGSVVSGATTTSPLTAVTLADGQVVIGSSIGPPIGATLSAGSNVTITSGHNTITIASSAGASLIWTDNSGTFNAVSGHGYFITAAATITMPAGAAQGATIAFVVDTASALNITGNTGQSIRIGKTVSASAGTCVNTQQGDSILLVFRAADSVWFSVGGVEGTWNIT